MREYDTTLKLLLQGAAPRSLHEVTGVNVVGWQNVELPEIGDRRVDLLGETAAGDLIHIELQSDNDSLTPLRMAEYCLRIYRQLQRFPRQTVLFVGRKRMRMAAELAGPQFFFRYELVDIREVDGEALLASDQVGDNVIAILTRLRRRAKAVREIIGRISQLEEDQREFYLQALLELAGLRGIERFVCHLRHKVAALESITWPAPRQNPFNLSSAVPSPTVSSER